MILPKFALFLIPPFLLFLVSWNIYMGCNSELFAIEQAISEANTRDSSNVRGTRKNEALLVEEGDFIYKKGTWTGAPIVVEEFKLLFFTQAKVACTTWNQLFRRMMGYPDWNVEEYVNYLPWNPNANGLKYLYDYDRKVASHMMTAPDWTRAIFVQDPKERFISAFLDRVLSVDGAHVREYCCPEGGCDKGAMQSLQGFLDLMQTCDHELWTPQSSRMEDKYWPYINFVGQMETLAQDAERLLRRLGAWEKYGETGWGLSKGRIFEMQSGSSPGRVHATNAKEKLQTYITTPELEDQIENYYARDYVHRALGLSRHRIHAHT